MTLLSLLSGNLTAAAFSVWIAAVFYKLAFQPGDSAIPPRQSIRSDPGDFVLRRDKA
jgi:hypothetical protein